MFQDFISKFTKKSLVKVMAAACIAASVAVGQTQTGVSLLEGWMQTGKSNYTHPNSSVSITRPDGDKGKVAFTFYNVSDGGGDGCYITFGLGGDLSGVTGFKITYTSTKSIKLYFWDGGYGEFGKNLTRRFDKQNRNRKITGFRSTRLGNSNIWSNESEQKIQSIKQHEY